MKLPDEQLNHLQSLYETQDFVEAIEYLKKLVKSYEKDIHAKHLKRQISACYEQLGKCHFRLGEYAPADKAFSKSTLAFPNNSATRLLQIESLIQRGEIEDAGQKMLDITNRFPNITLAPHYTELSAILLKIHGDYETSLFFFEHALTQERTDYKYVSANKDIVKNILEKNPDDKTSGLIHYVSNLSSKTATGRDALGLKLSEIFLSTRLKNDVRPEWKDTYHILLTKIYLSNQNFHLCRQHFNDAIQDKDISEMTKMAFHANLQRQDFATADELLKKHAASIVGDKNKWAYGFLQKYFRISSGNNPATDEDMEQTAPLRYFANDKKTCALLSRPMV